MVLANERLPPGDRTVLDKRRFVDCFLDVAGQLEQFVLYGAYRAAFAGFTQV
jgi:hypothetical protein